MASTMTASSRRTPSYFPKAEAPLNRRDKDSLPEWPKEIGPIFDQEHLDVPMVAFNETAHGINYTPDPASAQSTTKPTDFSDKYLFPSLTRHERLRLTMLWYYTAGITEDKELLRRLQDKVHLVKELIGWEFVIMGLVDSDVYMRLVTANLPLAILPRRESTCAHTINQPAGTVLMLPQMASDWRFKHSPHVEIGGLRSYAGTQLRVRTEHGEEIALGTLCVASNTEGETLSPNRQAALVRFADMLTSEVVQGSWEKRQHQRQHMSEMMAKLQSQVDDGNAEQLVLETVRQLYPGAQVEIQESEDGMIPLGNHTPISYSDVQDGLWEDGEYLDYAIENLNHQKLVSSSPIRAIVGACGPRPKAKYLVVASNDVQHVFDDIDSWFIEKCAFILRNIWQEHSLKEALKAKETFLRGITHQLRTPIHGVLGSVDLLTEELRSRNLLRAQNMPDGASDGSVAYDPWSFLTTIKTSGRELMSTVNNMLKLNRWAEISGSRQGAATYDLLQLETDIVNNISQTASEDDLANTAIIFHNQLPPECRFITTDVALLEDCIQALIVNAIQYTAHGSVVITISTADDRSLLNFDVVDTGCGISPENYGRIFEAYEKVDGHTRGAGLGLTLACRIANFLNGSVVLVSSEVGEGSHFRASFREPRFTAPTNLAEKPATIGLEQLPSGFYEVRSRAVPVPLSQYFATYLQHRGLHRSDSFDGSLIVFDFIPDVKQFQDFETSMKPDQIAICLMPPGHSSDHIDTMTPNRRIIFACGPFTTRRLDDILQQVSALYKPVRRTDSLNALIDATNRTLTLNESPPPLATPTVTIDPRSRMLPPRALLVDDNAINLRIMQMYCAKRSIPYTSAVDGREAVERFKNAMRDGQPFALVLMDLQMPVLDGAQACEEIRQLEKKAGKSGEDDMAIVFIITGQDSASDKTRSMAAGADRFLVKPVSITTLDKGIGAYFEGFPTGK